MRCRDIQAQITAYLGGELDGSAVSAVRGHLRVCEACRALAEDHAVLRDTLAELARPEAPPALWDGVLAGLGEAEIADARRSRWARLLDRVRPHLAPAGLAVAACAMAAVFIHRQSGGAARPVHVAELPAPAGSAAAVVPTTPPPPSPASTRDATAELADESARIEARYRVVAADLLEQARDAVGPGVARRRLDRDVGALESTVLAAAEGKARDRAWHALLEYLERATLGERVAVVPR